MRIARFQFAGRRGPGTLVTRTLAVGLTTAMAVLFMPTSAFAVGVAPSAPAQPTVATGNGSLSVAFVAPADGGSPITGYTATCASSNGGALGTASGTTSPITVGAVTNGSLYTCTVHATNVNGDSPESAASSSLIVGAPSRPAQPTLTHGDGGISVAFTAPAANGSAIQLYNVACASSDGGTSGSASDVASPVLVSALDNGKTYTCTVSATNSNGTGAASIASASTVPAGLPDSPLKPTVTRGNTQISVAFSAPANNGSPITGYSTTCTSSNGGTSGSLSGSASPLVVTGLTNGKTYTCKVLSTNAEGSSDLSVASSVTVPATVPAAPAQPTATHGAANATVSFVAPTDNGGSVIVGYTATCSSSDGGASGSNASVGSPITVSALTNAKTYTCTVHATNAVGDSIESPASASVFPATVPAVPAQPTVTRGNTQISVAFVAPANNGSTITGYTAACTSSDGGVFGSHSGGTSPIVVDSLTNGKTYTCTVFATNIEGDSAPSVASAAAVPATLPGAPAQPTLTHANASISVAFTAPVSNGGSAITSYTATCTSSDGGASGTNSGATSPVLVSVLTNGKTYTCTVLATNATGAGPASVPSASTVPATVPGVPAQPTVTHGNASISVAFTAPGSDGGSAITGFTAACTSSDGGASGSNAGATSPIVVPVLTNGKTYTCTVHATNAEGSGSDSIASTATIPATVPSVPGQPGISITGTTISVAFVAPADGGNAITGYTVSCVSSNGGSSGSNSGATSPIAVTGATLGKSYTCTVLATNGEGSSAASVASPAATVPAIAPSAPAAPIVTRGAGSISVAFVAPFDGGSAITGYTSSCTSSDGGASGSQSGATSPIVVSTLTNGKTYTCTVLATNIVGDSSASSASSAVSPAAVPSAPAAPTLTHGNAQISVAFVAPSNNGNVITGYTASCISSDGGVTGGNVGATSPIVVSALDNGKTYTCTVLATNAIGDGLPSPASAATVPATVPDAPAAPTLTRGDASISVVFVAPASGGSAITGYTASCASSDGGVSGSHAGISPSVVSSLTNGKTYTCTVHATNAEGNSAESAASAAAVPATLPTAPAQPTTVAAATHIAVSFVAPANGGAAITGYTASCVSSNGGVSGSNTGAGTPVSVASLSKGKSYTCTVHATNAVGDSSESPASAATVIPSTVPDAPAKPVTTPASGQISVAFGAPSDGGSAITGYSANCTSIDGGVPGSHSAGTSPIVVTGLDNGKTYTCAVLATNSVGDSDASVASDATGPGTLPGTPAAPTLTRGNASLSVAIVAPSDGGSAITGYTVACMSSDGGVSGSNSAASSPVVVSTLDNGKTYTCTAFATNAVGDGTPSPASATAVPATVPTAPAAPTLTRGNTSISVAFVAPATGGTAITAYLASCASSDGGTSGSNSGAASPIVVSSLTNGKTYTCTAHATNVVGNSTESAASGSAVPATVPTAPAQPTTTHADTAITVSFVAPATGGSAITGYTATCVSSDGGATGSNTGATSPIVVSALTESKTYTCTVFATNAVGNGVASVPTAAVVPSTMPSIPRKPTLARGNAQFVVSFLRTPNGGSILTGYTVTCTSTNGGVLGVQSGLMSPITVTGLTNGALYMCTVHATNANGSGSESVNSLVGRVGVRLANLHVPTIMGSPVDHRMLTVNNGSWRGAPAPRFSYRWRRCNLAVTVCTDIPHARGQSLVLRPADIGHKIRVIMTATNIFGSVVMRTRATAVVIDS